MTRPSNRIVAVCQHVKASRSAFTRSCTYPHLRRPLLCRFPEAHSHFSPKGGPITPREYAEQHPSVSAPVISPGSDSPLLAAGLVLNSATGRMIKIGGGTYQSLLEKGFSMDREAGAMIPPSRSPDMFAGDNSTPNRPSPYQRHTRRSGTGRSPIHGSSNSSATSPY